MAKLNLASDYPAAEELAWVAPRGATGDAERLRALMPGQTGSEEVTRIVRHVIYADKERPLLTEFREQLVSKYGAPTADNIGLWWWFDDAGQPVPAPTDPMCTFYVATFNFTDSLLTDLPCSEGNVLVVRQESKEGTHLSAHLSQLLISKGYERHRVKVEALIAAKREEEINAAKGRKAEL